MRDEFWSKVNGDKKEIPISELISQGPIYEDLNGNIVDTLQLEINNHKKVEVDRSDEEVDELVNSINHLQKFVATINTLTDKVPEHIEDLKELGKHVANILNIPVVNNNVLATESMGLGLTEMENEILSNEGIFSLIGSMWKKFIAMLIEFYKYITNSIKNMFSFLDTNERKKNKLKTMVDLSVKEKAKGGKDYSNEPAILFEVTTKINFLLGLDDDHVFNSETIDEIRSMYKKYEKYFEETHFGPIKKISIEYMPILYKNIDELLDVKNTNRTWQDYCILLSTVAKTESNFIPVFVNEVSNISSLPKSAVEMIQKAKSIEGRANAKVYSLIDTTKAEYKLCRGYNVFLVAGMLGDDKRYTETTYTSILPYFEKSTSGSVKIKGSFKKHEFVDQTVNSSELYIKPPYLHRVKEISTKYAEDLNNIISDMDKRLIPTLTVIKGAIDPKAYANHAAEYLWNMFRDKPDDLEILFTWIEEEYPVYLSSTLYKFFKNEDVIEELINKKVKFDKLNPKLKNRITGNTNEFSALMSDLCYNNSVFPKPPTMKDYIPMLEKLTEKERIETKNLDREFGGAIKDSMKITRDFMSGVIDMSIKSFTEFDIEATALFENVLTILNKETK